MSPETPQDFFTPDDQVFPDEYSRKIEIICAWCPDKDAREKAIRRRDPATRISHGICPDCRRRLEDQGRVDRLCQDARATGTVSVVEHPHGGWAHAVPVGPTARIYLGWWVSHHAAEVALRDRA